MALQIRSQRFANQKFADGELRAATGASIKDHQEVG
jgi:hypothetical protein